VAEVKLIKKIQEAREQREQEKSVQRDDDGRPVICDCPDGQSGPCDGRGWCGS
jgi:hypothetical protein